MRPKKPLPPTIENVGSGNTRCQAVDRPEAGLGAAIREPTPAPCRDDPGASPRPARVEPCRADSCRDLLMNVMDCHAVASGFAIGAIGGLPGVDAGAFVPRLAQPAFIPVDFCGAEPGFEGRAGFVAGGYAEFEPGRSIADFSHDITGNAS